MAKRRDAKSKALREHGSLNPRSQDVNDELFQQSEFFDPRDIVQVKYEMLRRVRVNDVSITRASAAFGVSRPTYYQAQAAFDRGGIPELAPKRPGPRQAHKLSDTVLRFIDEQRLKDKTLRAPSLAQMIQERFGISVHPRSIERAMSRRRKRGR